MSSSDEEDLNNTIIETQNENKRGRGRPSLREKLNRPRTQSESDIRKFLNNEGSEGDKKRKAINSPENNGKELKKQYAAKEQEEEMDDHPNLIKILEERWQKEEERRKAREELEKQRWEELSKKVDNSKEVLMKELTLMNEKMNGEIEGIKKEMKEVKERNRIETEEHKTKMAKLENALETIKKKLNEEKEKTGERITQGHTIPEMVRNRQQEKENTKTGKEIKWLVEEAERERKKKNITISGLDITEPAKLKEWVERKLGVKIEIRKTWRIRDKTNSIGAQLASKEQKEELMKKKSTLKTEQTKVYINNDTTWQERKNRKTVMEKAKELQENGQECKIGFNKITTNREEHYWNERADRWFRREKNNNTE